LIRQRIEQGEDERLAPWGSRAALSRGRLCDEPEHEYRTAFQRDRDRVLHSTAFRRLQYKTQVFVYHEGDHFRSRLTHTLEVSQIARTLARALGANEDLTEAIVLAHDLGHPPFGHSGERALDGLLEAHGGFEHNRQSLRVVDWIELRGDRYRGLNLTAETRSGILKHGPEYPRYSHPVPLPELGRWPRVEAQLANYADEIAYHNHDIDDGLRSGLLSVKQLADVRLWSRARELSRQRGSEGPPGPATPVVSALIHLLVTDLIDTSQRQLRESGASSPEEVEACDPRLVGFSPEVAGQKRELADFLLHNLYRHHQVVRMAAKAERILGDLWKAYNSEARLFPPHVLERAEHESPQRMIADYLAGMTDRFAIEEHRKLFDPHASV
jgi:dGTPase